MSELIKRCEDALISSLKLSKKTKYNTTRDDGFRVNITKIRNGASKKRPITKDNILDVKKLRYVGKSYKVIAKKLGINKGRVVRIMKLINNEVYVWKPNQELIKKFEKDVVKMRKESYSYLQIRKKLHTSSRVVSFILKKHNLMEERHSKRLTK